MNDFAVGDHVQHLLLKQRGVVSAVIKAGVYKVMVGSFEVVSKSDQLEIRSAPKETHYSKARQVSVQRKPGAKATLDLHGKNSADAKEELLQFISAAVLDGLREAKVIHGHGSGTVREMVHATLKSLSAVASFRHEINNTAVTKVYFT